jgi:predicted nuclease of restriction endonuclease-like RecB superfamily
MPEYIDPAEPFWLAAAEQLIHLFRANAGNSRGALEELIQESFASDPAQLVHQGLAKLLEDRCEFEVVADVPPEQLREKVFRLAAARRRSGQLFERGPVLVEAAGELNLSEQVVDQGLFADLKSEQRLIRFRDTTAERLLERYNVALAQAVLLRSTRVTVTIRHEKPARYRQLLRAAKFRRLLCEIEALKPDGHLLRFDGPMSLFSATQKYGLQLAQFLPAILLCIDFELKAELRWGPRRQPLPFYLSAEQGLVSHDPDTGTYVPPEIGMFVELFRKKCEGWSIAEESDLLPLGNSFWAPDFRLTQALTGKSVYLDVLGYWRRASALAHLRRLKEHARAPYVLAVSEQLHVDEKELMDLPTEVYRFRQMPLPEEVLTRATAALAKTA